MLGRLFARPSLAEVTPHEVHEAQARGEVLLIDVREPHEHAHERLPEALPMPLSRFDPSALPPAGERTIVLHCLGGQRSATAAARCHAAGLTKVVNMRGGLNAWKAASLPTITGPIHPHPHGTHR